MNDDSPQPDWSKVPLSEDFIWTSGVSGNGHPFKIGTPKPNTASTAYANQAPELGENIIIGTNNDKTLSVASKASFDINVNWQVTGPSDGMRGHPTAEETRITSITAYNLGSPGLKFYEFCFTCTEPYHFYFYDRTGDYYGNNVIWPRPGTIHWIYYWSSDPDIVRVTGS